MKLRTKFIVVISTLHLLALVLSLLIFKSNPEYFLLAEALLLISAAISWQLYRQMIRPLQTIVEGIEAIKSKDFNVKFLHSGSFEMDQLIDVYNEMMNHLKTERTRQEQQHFFLEKLIHTSPTGILILDFDGRVQQLNPKAALLLGIKEEDILKQTLSKVDVAVGDKVDVRVGDKIDFREGDKDFPLPEGAVATHIPVPEGAGGGRSLAQEITLLQSGESKTISTDGVHTYKIQRSHFIDRGFPRSFVMIEELTEEILAAEKKAYGKVIRMMAHEVNNTIGPVNSILDSTLKTTSLWTPEHETLNHALQVALQRNENLNIFMRRFADVVRLPSPEKSQFDLNHLLKDVVTLFEMKAKDTGIDIHFQFSEEKFTITADRQQIEQALINIILNAIEAIENKGSIRISTNRQSGLITILDSGSGISSEHSEHLFSPFFSTKKNGQGVGLTLVKEILLNHGFEFSLKKAEGVGTVFEIRV